jgi:hypothetical protein
MAEVIGYNSNRKLGRMSKETERRFNSAQERLLLGQQYRQKERENAWRESYDVYMGDQWNVNPDDPTADVVNVNISFSTINTLVPFVADEDPHFLISPMSGDADADSAQLLETFMNRLWQSPEVRGQEGLSDAVFDWLLYGDGYVDVGYNIRMLPVFDAQGNPVDNKVRVAEFHVRRINPWDVWIDPYSDGIHNARWVARRIVLPIEELVEDERYKIKKREDVDGAHIDPRHQSAEDRSRLDDVDIDNWVTIYEFYDITEKWMMSFMVGHDAPVRYIEQVQCPIRQILNYRVPNSPYHMGELEQILSLQHELNKTRSQMITHRRRNIGKWAIAEDRLTDEAIAAMQSGRVNDVIPISGPDMPLENLINYIAPQPMSRDAYEMDGVIRSDINELTGVNEYLRGIPQDISRTATEASIIEGATNIRTRHKLLAVERAARDIGQTLLDVIRDVLPLTDFNEMAMYVTGREAEKINRASGAENIHQNAVLTPVPEIFEGRYIVEVERGSTELRNPQVKAQKLQQMVTLMLNATPVLMELQIPFNIKRLLELWFEAEGIEDVDALFEIGEEQEVMQQMALMERAMAAAGQGGGAGGAEPPGQGAGRTPPGEPRGETTGPPSDMINPSNSGMLPSR